MSKRTKIAKVRTPAEKARASARRSTPEQRKRLFDYAKLVEARLLRGWTRSTLAKHCGLHYSTISRLESGEHESPETIKKVGAKLGFSMKQLLLKTAVPRINKKAA